MKKATVVVYEEDEFNSMFDAMFGDLHNDPDVYFLVEKEHPQQGLYHYLLSEKLKKLTFGLNSIFSLSYYSLPRLIADLNKRYDHVSVLMHNACLRKPKYPLGMFKRLRKKASFNLLYTDVHERWGVCTHANYLFENKAFDRVFTIDPSDAETYEIELCSTPYSYDERYGNIASEKKMYFCGSNSGRIYPLYRIWAEAKKRNMSVEYDLTGAKDYMEFFEQDENVRCGGHISYDEVLKRSLESSCIIDIVQKDQKALTLRPYEAVVYNRKLLTNNRSILDFKYYNSRYMQLFERAEEIDWDWIAADTEVDYGYQGDYSPRKLLELLE
ncbi:MAG: hypothetical protein IJH53_09400 [Oscillospiraceae bacterium]|nr:hypothetical protein [Oscillospiraceae bacterium]